MTYDQLLAAAPPHDSPEFLEYLRKHNKVVFDGDGWLVIENFKYPWLTAFAKNEEWWDDMDVLAHEYPDAEWRKKPKEKQTVTRFHLHILV